MEIRTSFHHKFLDVQVQEAARKAGCYARVKWATTNQCRFILLDRPLSTTTATFAQHDAVIAALLDLDPDAYVRTARATYEGRDDMQAQLKARAPA